MKLIDMFKQIYTALKFIFILFTSLNHFIVELFV